MGAHADRAACRTARGLKAEDRTFNKYLFMLSVVSCGFLSAAVAVDTVHTHITRSTGGCQHRHTRAKPK